MNEQLERAIKKLDESRKEYLAASEQLLKLLNPTPEELAEAEEGAGQYFEDFQPSDHLNYEEILGDIVYQNREERAA